MTCSRPAGYELSDDPQRLQPAAIGRVVTDHATFAHLADVYVLAGHGEGGLATAMLRYFDTHHDLQSLRRCTLNTQDAHGLFERHGWEQVTGIFMQRYDADVARGDPA